MLPLFIIFFIWLGCVIVVSIVIGKWCDFNPNLTVVHDPPRFMR